MTDLLADARWRCTSTDPGVVAEPTALAQTAPEWIDATVPGTAAAALRDAGRWEWGQEDSERLDGRDWWFTAPIAAACDRPCDLRLEGIATLADVWLDGEHLVHSENMFVPVTVTLPQVRAGAELVIRCAALNARLAQRHRRPRFKSRLVRHQALRWYRTTLLGRMPGWSRWAAPVGPWRPVTLEPLPDVGAARDVRIDARCLPDGAGEVTVTFTLAGAARAPGEAVLDVDGARAPLTLTRSGDGTLVTGTVVLEAVRRWWPHTHGEPVLYPVMAEIDGTRVQLRRVGFRTIGLRREKGAFALSLNGREIFCRGVTWGAGDAVSLRAGAGDVALAREAGLNLIRLGGYGIYEDADFWDRCDALGIMVWQDVMIASVDPPDDPAWVAELGAELDAQFGALSGRPALVMACGSSETYQQGSMYGFASEHYRSEVLERVIPERLTTLVPGIPYVPSSPSGGEPPIRTDEGVTHYFGVGAYLRAPDDARLAGVRFAAECLSFATPPGPGLVRRVYGSAAAAGHEPRWKLAAARDAGTSWDFEDVRDHYVQTLFGVDPLTVRYADPEHALDLGRAAIAELVTRVLGDWRAPSSGCAGAVMLAWRDLWPGAGWGVLDADGARKASFHALARACRPRTVLLRDLGLNGLVADVYADGPDGCEATLSLTCFDGSGAVSETAAQAISLGPHGHRAIGASSLFGGFRDLTNAYRFSSSPPDAVLATLTSAAGAMLARAVHLPGGPARPRTPSTGLRAVARPARPGCDDRWMLTLCSERLATFVSVDAPGHEASDGWFHLAPGETTSLTLTGTGPPSGVVRALNATGTTRITVAGT